MGTRQTAAAERADLVLIGGGIMSATLASMVTVLQPDWRIVVLERGSDPARESSDPWNNAGTGHSGFCELNYMPDPQDGRRPGDVARQFNLTRQWWSHLAKEGLVEPRSFIHRTPHMSVVFGDKDVQYLEQRYRTLRTDPFFAELEYSQDPARIARWAPLVMDGRASVGPIAATRHPRGTDVDFGALTQALLRMVVNGGGAVRTGHEARRLRRRADGSWAVSGKRTADGAPFTVHGRHVFVGAGGFALRLLQQAGLPEVRGYAVLPVGAAFFRCTDPAVVSRHNVKAYGQAALGAPPMSVPHLDKRLVDGAEYLMFGPYATFSTKLLKAGRLTDFFTTLRWRNLHVIAAAGLQNRGLLSYLIRELAANPREKFRQLQRYYPAARFEQWELLTAGQRAQLVVPDRRRIGVLAQGTELVCAEDGSLSGLLGASPGASTAVPIMLDALRRCFPEHWNLRWSRELAAAMPGLNRTEWDAEAAAESFRETDKWLGLEP